MADKKPPEISTGSFVSWSGGKGRVAMVVTNGKVPGVEGDVEGSSSSPAAQVVVYENDKATKKKIGMSTHKLKRIAPIGAAAFGKKSLVSVHSDHEAKCADLGLPDYARLSGMAVKTAYDRGLHSWPGEAVTTLTAEEWALGRVEYLVKVAAGDVIDRPGNDTDLLDDTHPTKTAADEGDESFPLDPTDDDLVMFTDEDLPPVEPVEPPEGAEPVDPPPGTTEVAPQPEPSDKAETEGEPKAEEKAATFTGGASTVLVDAQTIEDEIEALLR